MADEDKFLPMQESVLTLLCLDQQAGSTIAAQVAPAYFDGVYRDFATRVLQYRRRYGKPPGKSQIRDISERSFAGQDEVVVRKRLLPLMLAGSEGINTEYVLSRTQDWVERQLLKGAIMTAGDRYDAGGEGVVDDVKKLLYGALRFQTKTVNAGLFLNEPRLLQFSSRTDEGLVSLGIPHLDHLGIGLVPKEMLLYIAPKGSGKTWFCIHCGKMGLVHHKKVLHVSNEMSEEKVGRRYLQALFAVARQTEPFKRTRLVYDDDYHDLRRMTGFKTRRFKPKLAFTQSRIRRVLRRRQRAFGTRLGNLVVKDFPSGQMTLEMLESYLDYLADVKQFVPDILIVDYPDLMAIQAKTQRIDIGQNFVGLRGIAQQRNMALVTPTQGNRATIGARRVRSTGAADDISKVFTADTVLAFSRTAGEAALGLGRLAIEHSRDSEGGSVVLLAQSYSTGQYVLDSAVLQNEYWTQLKELGLDDPEVSDK